MNTTNYQILEELLAKEISTTEQALNKNEESRGRRLSWGHATDLHDLTKDRLSARLELLNETLGQLIDWSNN